MNHRQIIENCLAKVLAKLPDERLRQVFDFAEFLAMQEEQAMWSRPSPEALAEMYADDEPDYSEADIAQCQSHHQGEFAMPLTFEAIYENGVLKPVEPLPLKEHEKVTIT